MNFKVSNRRVKDLLNNESVIVLSEGFAYNTIVEWTLADFMEDEPPFVEVNFNDRCEGDTIYYTDNLNSELFELGDCLVLIENSEEV